MKLNNFGRETNGLVVAPFTGAWIETFAGRLDDKGKPVAPFTGAWIETDVLSAEYGDDILSLPSRERGLKLVWELS